MVGANIQCTFLCSHSGEVVRGKWSPNGALEVGYLTLREIFALNYSITYRAVCQAVLGKYTKYVGACGGGVAVRSFGVFFWG